MDACVTILKNIGWALSVAAGHVMVRQGERPDCTFYVLSGTFQAIRRQAGGEGLVVGTITQGDWVCEMSGLLGGEAATADVVALDAAELIEITSGRLKEFMTTHPRQACEILGSVAAGIARRLDEEAARQAAGAILGLAKDLAGLLNEQNIRRERDGAVRD